MKILAILTLVAIIFSAKVNNGKGVDKSEVQMGKEIVSLYLLYILATLLAVYILFFQQV